MSVSTSGEYEAEWTSQTENRPDVQSRRPAKRRRTESYGLSTQERGLMRNGGDPGVPRFIGSGSGIHFISPFCLVLFLSESNVVPSSLLRRYYIGMLSVLVRLVVPKENETNTVVVPSSPPPLRCHHDLTPPTASRLSQIRPA